MKPRNVVTALGFAFVAALALIFVVNVGYVVVCHHANTVAEKKSAAQQRKIAAYEFAKFVAVTDEAPSKGALRIKGHVIDANGLPVAKAKIVIADAAGHEITSNSDGSFEFDGLAARRYTLFGYAASGIAGPVTVQLQAKLEPIVLHVRAATSLTVRVRDARNKQPIAGAKIEVRGPIVYNATTDRDGRARIDNVAPGDVQVMARAQSFARQFNFAHVSADPNAAAPQVELLLVAGAPVSGVVQDTNGRPVANAQVSYEAVSTIVPIDARRDSVESDAEGRFQLDALPAGSIHVTASHAPDAPGTSELLTLDGTTPRTGVVVKLQEGVTVKGVVFTEAGTPLAGAEVRLVSASADVNAGAGARQTQSDARGEFVLRGVARGRVALAARHESGASGVVEVATGAGATVEVRLVIGRTASIAGRVVDSTGKPVATARVALNADRAGAAKMTPSEWLLAGAREEAADDAGRFEIRGVASGRYELRASRGGDGAGGPGRERLSAPIIAEAGARDVVLVVAPPARFIGRVALKGGGVPPPFTVALGARTPIPFASDDGSFVIEDLPATRVDVTVRGLSFMPKTISDAKLSAGETTDLGTIEVDPGRTITGRVVAGGVPVAGAAVRAGRVLFNDGSSRKNVLFGTRESETDNRGEFTLIGVGANKLFVSAEHPERGRSQPFEVPAGDASVSDVVLSLDGFGALAGRVVKAGTPVESVLVNVRPLAKTSGVFYGGKTRADGTFRFDKLPPGPYKVWGTKTSPSGRSFQAVAANVVNGKTAEVELDIGGGDLSLSVAVVPPNGTIAFATVALCEGIIAPHTSTELTAAMAAIDHGYSAMGTSFKGSPATFKQLAPAHYTACAAFYPPSVSHMSEAKLYAEKNDGKQAVTCIPVDLVAGSPQKHVEIRVALPPKSH